MKKFSFNLESVLGLRKWEEQRSQQAFAEAASEVAKLEERISAAESQATAVFENWNASSGTRFSRNERLAMIGNAEALQKSRLEAEELLREANEKRREAMDRLKEAVRAKKVVETLKQRRLDDYRAEVERIETQEVEDAFNSRRRKGI
jgi:flagellar FliJ protein